MVTPTTPPFQPEPQQPTPQPVPPTQTPSEPPQAPYVPEVPPPPTPAEPVSQPQPEPEPVPSIPPPPPDETQSTLGPNQSEVQFASAASEPSPVVSAPESSGAPASHGTSPVLPIVGAAILVVVIVAGIYFYSKYTTPQSSTQPVSAQKVVEPQPTAIPTTSPSALGNTSTTDAQLNTDVDTVSKSLDSLDKNMNDIDTGLSDQQTNLE